MALNRDYKYIAVLVPRHSHASPMICESRVATDAEVRQALINNDKAYISQDVDEPGVTYYRHEGDKFVETKLSTFTRFGDLPPRKVVVKECSWEDDVDASTIYTLNRTTREYEVEQYITTDKYGIKRYHKIVNGDEVLHRLDGPAVVDASTSSCSWYVDGYRQSINDQPSIVTADAHMWHHKGKLHRTTGPAYIDLINNDQHWFVEDHRQSIDDKPSIISYNTQSWHHKGDYHRTTGPAIVYENGSELWYKDGKLHRDNGLAVTIKDDKTGLNFYMGKYINGELKGEMIFNRDLYHKMRNDGTFSTYFYRLYEDDTSGTNKDDTSGTNKDDTNKDDTSDSSLKDSI